MASNERPVTLERRRRSLDHPPTFSPELRVLLFGGNAPSQFSLSNSILREEVFENGTTNIAQCVKHMRDVFDRKIVLVNMPDLSDYDASELAFKNEFKRCVTMSCPGPHAALLVLDLCNISPSALGTLQLITMHLGKRILSHTMVVVCHEGERDDTVLQERVKANRDFRELIEKCGQRYHLFNERKARTDEGVTRDLLGKIEHMVEANGGGFYSNLDYKDAEVRIRRIEKSKWKRMAAEMLRKRKELESQYAGDKLAEMVRQYETRVGLENREKAERKVAEVLGFSFRVVDYAAAIGKGAAVGFLFGAAMGYEGAALGAVLGAVMGGVIGGIPRAIWHLVRSCQ